MAQPTPNDNQAATDKALPKFKDLKAKISIFNIITHYSLTAHYTQNAKGEWEGPCPFHCHGLRRGGFTISQDGSKWNSFDKECHCVDGLVNSYTKKPTRGGDLIIFVVIKEKFKINSGIGQAKAGKFLQEFLNKPQVTPEEVKPAPKEEVEPKVNLTFAERELKLPTLEAHHIALQDFDLEPDYLESIGAGVQVKGIMPGRLLFPIDNLKGERVAYGGMALKDDEPKWQYPKDFDPSLELHGYAQVVQWLKETIEQAPVVYITFNLLTQAIVAQADYAVAILSDAPSFAQKDALIKLAGVREGVEFHLFATPEDRQRVQDGAMRDFVFLLSKYAKVRQIDQD